MVYKSCPDLSLLAGTTSPVVNPETEYRSAYKQSAGHQEHFNTNNSTVERAAATAADNNDIDDTDGINEVCNYLYIFYLL